MISFDVSHRRVVVTGGSSGIGYAVAQAFAEAGAAVTIVAEVEAVHDAAARLHAATGADVRAIRCDICNAADVARLAQELEPFDVLVNNAGIVAATPVDGGDLATFERIIDVNLTGQWAVTLALAGRIPSGGTIIFTSSLFGRTARAGFGAYIASKHAVLGLVRTLAIELGPRGITVNAVCPGTTETDQNLRDMPKDVVAQLTTEMKLRPGLIPVEAIAGAFVFLASPAASEMTGQALTVDRGQLIA